MPLPNRLAVYITAAGALALGLLPLVGNLDWTSTAGILGAIAAIAYVVREWLHNWGRYERGDGPGILPAEEFDELDDGFDEQTADPIPDAVAKLATLSEPGATATGSPPPGANPAR
jgi:hypothetical protein